VITPGNLNLDAPMAGPAPAPGGGGASLEDGLWALVESERLTLAQAMEQCERLLVHAALRAEHDNRTRAATRLGINVRTIFKKLRG